MRRLRVGRINEKCNIFHLADLASGFADSSTLRKKDARQNSGGLVKGWGFNDEAGK